MHLKMSLGSAYVLTSVVFFFLFFSISVDIAYLQQLIWEIVFPAKEGDWDKRLLLLLLLFYW